MDTCGRSSVEARQRWRWCSSTYAAGIRGVGMRWWCWRVASIGSRSCASLNVEVLCEESTDERAAAILRQAVADALVHHQPDERTERVAEALREAGPHVAPALATRSCSVARRDADSEDVVRAHMLRTLERLRGRRSLTARARDFAEDAIAPAPVVHDTRVGSRPLYEPVDEAFTPGARIRSVRCAARSSCNLWTKLLRFSSGRGRDLVCMAVIPPWSIRAHGWRSMHRGRTADRPRERFGLRRTWRTEGHRRASAWSRAYGARGGRTWPLASA